MRWRRAERGRVQERNLTYLRRRTQRWFGSFFGSGLYRAEGEQVIAYAERIAGSGAGARVRFWEIEPAIDVAVAFDDYPEHHETGGNEGCGVSEELCDH
jgi:hypothetical protein